MIVKNIMTSLSQWGGLGANQVLELNIVQCNLDSFE